MLLHCIDHLKRQTRPIDELIIADASSKSDAAETERAIRDRHGDLLQRVRFVFIHTEPSVARQRNRLVRETNSGIVMLIDDDALAKRDYVEKIMAVYEADVDGRVAGVQGHAIEGPPAQAYFQSLDGSISGAAQPRTTNERARARPSAVGRLRSSARRLIHRASVRYVGGFIPPHMDGIKHSLPEGLPGNPMPKTNLYGCVMSFRRDAALRHPGNELLDNYSFLEDFAMSFPMAFHQALAKRTDAELYHVQATGVRGDPGALRFFYLINMSVIFRQLPMWDDRAARHLLRHHRRWRRVERVWSLLLNKGPAGLHGAQCAIEGATQLFAATDDEVANVYRAAVQQFHDERQVDHQEPTITAQSKKTSPD
jgi:glycosyltransferase involved in cell wall biosynthesis